MTEGLVRAVMEWSALGIEMVAVSVIVVATLLASGRYLLHLAGRNPMAFSTFKARLGRALLLGLELLVAADIVRTVSLEATLNDIASLGALVLVRTFLSWSIVVETDGRWPWQAAAAAGKAV